jgi:hypothetical protein
MNKVFLYVPYEERERAKVLGAMYDPEMKSWYCDDGKKICIVSPELQGRPHDIQKHRDHFIEKGVLPDAICCKINNIIDWI